MHHLASPLVALATVLAACGSTGQASSQASPPMTSTASVSTSRSSQPADADRTPPGRVGASLSSDGDSLLLLGGSDYSGPMFQDQWQWHLGRWTRDRGSPIPPGRFGPASVWDPRTRSVVMFGGTFANTGVDPAVGRVTWVHNDGKWMARRPTHIPPMDGGAFVYDQDTRTVLLVGPGVDHARDQTSEQIWSWDGSDWAHRPTPSAPPGRLDAAAVYDPIGHVVLLFGGHMGLPDQLDDTWAYDGRAWRQLHPATEPTGGDAVAATDTTHHRAVLVTESDGGTWTWTGSDWQRLFSPQSPPAGLFAAMTDDPADRGVALVTGKAFRAGRETLPGELWIWDGRQWTLAWAHA
jgi:hypothetical protein